MKILQVSTTDLGGGAEGSAWNLFDGFRARGHESWLVVGRKRSDDPDVFEIPEVECYTRWNLLMWALYGRTAPWEGRLPGIRSLRQGLHTLAGGKPEIERLLGREDFNFPGTSRLLDLTPEPPDIVHLHNLHGDYFDLRFLAPLSKTVPVVLNLRDMWLLTGHCAYPVGCERWKTGCGKCPDLSIYPSIARDATAYNWRRKRRIYGESRLHLCAISEWLRGRVQESMLSGVDARVILNAIDLSVFKPKNMGAARREFGLPQNAKIVLATAQTDFKDLDLIESAFRKLAVCNLEEELLCVCLGRTGRDRAVGAGRMVFPGFERDPRRMALYYAAADVFIHAAKSEAFGKTIVEAMACQRPVVATAVDAVAELIDDGKNGFLVNAGDDELMAARVQMLLDDPALAEQIGKQAARVAHERFSLERQVDEYLCMYADILAQEEKKYVTAHAFA